MQNISPLQLTDVSAAFVDDSGVEVWMLHESPHPLAGNKRYKLERNLDRAVEDGRTGIVSFGGAWSNHIAALAYAARQRNLRCVCFIRGETTSLNNPTLRAAQKLGMGLEFIDRAEYRLRYDEDWLSTLQQRYPDYLILPEGGSNELAVENCRTLLDALDTDLRHSFSTIASPVGTGATLAGLRLGVTASQQARGYLAVRDPDTPARIQQWCLSLRGVAGLPPLVLVDASAPGYARLNDRQYQWVNEWFEKTRILLDPVYTVKMVSKLAEEINAGEHAPGSRILLIHTGGFQGWWGWREGARQVMASQRLNSSVRDAINHCLAVQERSAEAYNVSFE